MEEKLKTLKEERAKDLKDIDKQMKIFHQNKYKDCYKCKKQKETGIYKMHNYWKYC